MVATLVGKHNGFIIKILVIIADSKFWFYIHYMDVKRSLVHNRCRQYLQESSPFERIFGRAWRLHVLNIIIKILHLMDT